MIPVVRAYPPIYSAIADRFPVRGKPVIFAYGDVIYNPTGPDLTEDLRVHEEVHCARQLVAGVDAWWARYLTEVDFRLEEELVAHRAEYRLLTRALGATARERHLRKVATKLAAPLYGSLITIERAIEELR
jgi:hypothetical protein